MSDALVQRGVLRGHDGWVTSIATTDVDPSMIVTGSRDRSIIQWRLSGDGENIGFAEKRLTGHRHFVSDVNLSSDGQFVLSSSWDCSLRLWSLAAGKTVQFNGHEKDVLSCAFSPDNRHILSCGRDKSIRHWNTIGKLVDVIPKFPREPPAHDDWVSCVRFSPVADSNLFVTAGHDKHVKVWSLDSMSLKTDLVGHTGYVSTVTVSPDGSLCASGGKDGVAMLWDLTEGKKLYTLDTNGAIINSLCFSPNRYWLCAATNKNITIWDLESKNVVAELKPDLGEKSEKALAHYCTSIAWSGDGSTLYSGYTDKTVRVWSVASAYA